MNKRSSQRGAILLTSLVLLLLISIIGASVMRTSNLEMKMATAMEMKEISFQTAEAIIEESMADNLYLAQAFDAQQRNPGSPDWPTKSHAYTGYNDTRRAVNARGNSEMRFLTTAPTSGYSIRKGSAGLETYYYEIEAVSAISDTNINNTHIQGVYLDAPRVN